MEDPSRPLELFAGLVRWSIALVAALVVFLLYRWLFGPSLGLIGTIVGAALFAAVALGVRQVQERARVE